MVIQDVRVFQAKDAQGLPLPARAHLTDAGFDFRVVHGLTLRRYHCGEFRTATTIDFPLEEFVLGGLPCRWAFIIFPRTGLGGRNGVINGAWIFDSAYRDRKGMTFYMWNWGRKTMHFKRGDRFAQGCFIPVGTPRLRLATEDEITWDTDRKTAGDGSTGLA